MNIIITDHAYKRGKERMGLNKCAIKRLAKKAYIDGINHKESVGRLHKYIDKIYLQKKNINQARVYGEFLYLFSDNRLVTIYLLDNYLKKLLK